MNPTAHLAFELPTEFGQAPVPAAAPDARAALAAQFIPAGARVLDLSGVGSALQALLPHGCGYQGGSVINAGEFPTEAGAQADIIVMLGVLERIADVDSVFTHLRFCKQDVILSCSPTDLSPGGKCPAPDFVNQFSFCDLALLFDRYGFRIECTAPIGDTETLIRLTPSERIVPAAPCSVAVISECDLGGFGERLGYHMINAMLPGCADVHHLTPRTLHEARGAYDLVVLGTGNSLFPPLIGDDVIDVLGRGKAAIGIFGTYFRELIPRPSLERILERLDTWYARGEDDVLMYGRGRDNVVYLGDWMIEQFPLARASDEEPLRVSDEIGAQRALDRAIQIIQRHKQVYSNQLHPLLCALTSAELVAYADQSLEQMPHHVSGNFRSMLIDIFGRSYPEHEFFMVDRDAVARYKARVHANVAMLRERIEATLTSVARVAA
jgi:hypothetical protein